MPIDPILLYPLALAAALGLALAGVRLAMGLGRAWGLIDRPGPRRVHGEPTPRTGGIGIAGAALLAAGLILAALGVAGVLPDGAVTPWVVFGVAATAMLAVGVADDALDVPGHYKLLALIAASLAVAGAGVRIDALALNTNVQTVHLHWLGWPATVAWVCGVTVAILFVDGLDGLAGGVGAIVALVIAWTAATTGQVDVAVAALALAGAAGGFLVYNGPWGRPARVFMGDGGTMFLGFALATLAAMLNGRPGVGSMRALVLPAVALGVPILDTGLTLVRRKVLQRRSLFAAEDQHVHHRLLAIGLNARHAVFLIWGVTVAASLIAVLATWLDGLASLGLLAMLAPLWVGLFRTAGSVRGRDTVAAVRRHRKARRLVRRSYSAFEEAQIRLRRAGDFGEWWRETCHAAEALDFQSLRLTTSRRDGEPYELEWERPGSGSADDAPTVDEPEIPQVLDVTLDVPQRRLGDGARMRLAARVRVGSNLGVGPVGGKGGDKKAARAIADLETAGVRVTLFTRLLCEGGLATMDDPDRARWATMHRRRAAWLAPAAEASREDDGEFPALARLDRPAGEPRVAIVHDFLYVYGGAEKVLEQMLEVFPHADLFSVIDFVPPADRAWLKHKPATTTFIQRLPLARYKHRAYLPLMPMAIEQLDVGGYDVVLSSSYCVAKGVLVRPDQAHVCYCHSPVRFAWDLQKQYLAEAGIGPSWWPHRAIKNLTARLVLHYLRLWDARSAAGVDVFLANSDFVGRRIEKAYRRQSETVYPPVDTGDFTPFSEKQGYYFTSSRMVPYKRMAMIAEAFTRTPERRLVMSGDGPEFERIKRLAGPNVQLVGHQPREKFVHYMQRARAFVFAAEEDFGIVPVEAMACGTPVIAFGRGGATETVVDGVTGVHFDRQTPESLLAAVDRFEAVEAADGWDARAIGRHAGRFGVDRFRGELRSAVMSAWSARRPTRQAAPREPAGNGTPTNGHAPRLPA